MKKFLKIIGIIFLVTIVLSLVFGGSKKSDTTQKYKYEELARVENKNDESVSVLISSNETDPEGLAKEVQKTCKKQCNISLFDDKKAYELDAEYTKMTSNLDTNPNDVKKWKEDNYVFVGDHLVGQVGYSFGDYNDYPLRDWYYEELKAK